MPLHGFRVELYERDVQGDTFLGVAVTDAQGAFAAAYDPSHAGLGERPDLRLVVVDYAWEAQRARNPEDGGGISYASLGQRNGAFGDETDLHEAPTPKDATVQPFLGNALVAVDYGYIIKNEDGDVPPGLIELLEAHRADFKRFRIQS